MYYSVNEPVMEELSTVTGIENAYWKSTCEHCAYRGNRKEDYDFASIQIHGGFDPDYKSIECIRFPDRCTSCGTKAKRFTRMKNSLDKLVDIKLQLAPQGLFSRLKMITITNKNNLNRTEFTKRFKEFRDNTTWMIGGTYVLEQGTQNGMWHMHGVFIAPYINKEHFDDLTLAKSGEHYGLGNVHYQEAKLEKKFRSRHLENYIAKYMCKDGNRKQSFGALYCCIEENINDTDGKKIATIWTQPNPKYKQQLNDWKGLVKE